MSIYTTTIRSINKTNATDNSNACSIKMNCSTHSRYIRIRVKNVFISHKSTEVFVNTFAELRAGFSFCNGYDTNNSSARTIAFTDLASFNTCQSDMTFIIENPANKLIEFSLFNEIGAQLQSTVGGALGAYNSNWFVTMECEPLNEIV